MTKTDKKKDKLIRELLTDVCESEKQGVTGFMWLTHQVNFKQFPQSLIISCAFSDVESKQLAKEDGSMLRLTNSIESALNKHSINLINVSKQIRAVLA